MSKKEDQIANVLGTSPSKQVASKQEIIVPEDSELQNIEEIKDTYVSIVDKGLTAIEELSMIAASTEDPKAYAALATVMKATGSHIKAVEKIVMDKQKPEKEKEEGSGGDTINNTINFNGTTAELAELIRNTRKQDD